MIEFVLLVNFVATAVMTGALTRLTTLFVHIESAPFKALIEIRPGSYAPISPVIEIL